MAPVLLTFCLDSCLYPPLRRWRDEFAHTSSCALADWKQLRKTGILRRKPEKGFNRMALAIGWVLLHTFALVVFVVYGAFAKGPGHASWWLFTTLLAFYMYVALMYSDPGFIDAETLVRLTREVDLEVKVVASDAGRGLLQDAEGAVPEMAGLRPADEGGGSSSGAGPSSAGIELSTFGGGAAAAAEEEPADTKGVLLECGGASGGGTFGGVGGSSSTAHVGVTSSTKGKRKEKILPRARIDPTAGAAAAAEDGGAGAGAGAYAHNYGDAAQDALAPGAAGAEVVDEEDALAAKLARCPRIVGYDEPGAADVERELERVAEARRAKPLGLEDYFSGYCDDADMYLPIRAKYCKKHGRIVSKFDHYCYAIGTSVGELNHGRFYRLVFMQTLSIWNGKWLLDHAYLSMFTGVVWTAANLPLLILNLVTWLVGVPLTILLLIHTFMALTASTTYEFIKLEKLEYMNGFYQFSYPFSEGLLQNLRHFCCPAGLQLWRRAPPEHEWPETFWNNRYYSCCG